MDQALAQLLSPQAQMNTNKTRQDKKNVDRIYFFKIKNVALQVYKNVMIKIKTAIELNKPTIFNVFLCLGTNWVIKAEWGKYPQ